LAKKLNLSVILPTVQVVITATLVLWAGHVNWVLLGGNRAPGRFVRLYLYVIEARTIWRGVNAPAFLCTTLAQLLQNHRILGFGLNEDFLYIVAVAVLWYFVGRLLDRRSSSMAAISPGITIAKAAVLLTQMAIGGVLFLVSVWTIRDELSFARAYFFRADGFIVATLFMAWSLVLLIFPGRRLGRGFRFKGADAKSEIVV
jgi:hypothetical protein